MVYVRLVTDWPPLNLWQLGYYPAPCNPGQVKLHYDRKKGQSCLFLSRKLRFLDICSEMLMFNQSVVVSVLFYAAVIWGGSNRNKDARKRHNHKQITSWVLLWSRHEIFNVSPLTQQGAKMSSYNNRQPIESSVTLLPRADKQTDAYWLQCLGHLFMFINEIGSYLQSFANMPKRVCSLSKLDCDCLETGCPLKCDLYCHLFSWKWSPRDSDYCTCNLLGDQLVNATTFSSIGSWMQNKK